jgi:TonB family protein
MWACLSLAVEKESDDALAGDAPGRYTYHLRVVRVVGDSSYRGAGLGCEDLCGKPVVVPSAEAWGTPEQLAALARSLGGTRADAVTGFVVQSGSDDVARFEGTVYPGETAVRLVFSARTRAGLGDTHDIEVQMLPLPGGVPLAETRLIAATNKTIVVAAPSPIESEWVVLAVTPLDPVAARNRVEQAGQIHLLGSVSADRLSPPERIHLVMPQYPAQARKERRSGKVIIEAVIDAEGYVRAPRVLKVPQDSPDLAAGAVEAVVQWRYKPALLDGQPVAVYFTLVVEFALN